MGVDDDDEAYGYEGDVDDDDGDDDNCVSEGKVHSHSISPWHVFFESVGGPAPSLFSSLGGPHVNEVRSLASV